MLVQVGLQGEGLSAAGTGVRLGVGVRLDVSAEIALVGEGLLADVALEGLLAGVGADVSLEEPGAGEALAAELALASLVVGAHVHGVRRHGDVDLLAVGTVAGLFVHNRPIDVKVTD